MGASTTTSRPRRSPGDIVVIVLFGLLLLAPAVLALLGHAGFDTAFIEHTELRRPFVAPAPTSGALATGGWERDAEREIADAFPLRRQLIEGYNRAKYSWLHDIASSHVLRGRDGWLFLGDEEQWYLTGEHRPTDADLARLAGLYAARARWCSDHGIAYVFLLVPNKSTVYADELPADMRIERPTPADRLLPLMRARGLTVVDMRDELRALARSGAGRDLGEVYSRADTHWTDIGAYAAYVRTVRALRSAGVREAKALDSRQPRVVPGDGDLLKLAGISGLVQNRIVRYDYPHRAHEIPPPVYPNDPGAAAFSADAFILPDPSLPKAVVFGDSFTNVLAPFLAESFRRTVVLRHVSVTGLQFDPHVLEAEKPQVVIQELAERFLVFAPDFKE